MENGLNIKKIFRRFDLHKRNALDLREFSQIMKIIDETLQAEEIEYIFNKIDESKDKLIEFVEFNNFLK